MIKRLPTVAVGVLLLALSGAAQAQCENLRVIVRNSVYPINGLETFCTELEWPSWPPTSTSAGWP